MRKITIKSPKIKRVLWIIALLAFACWIAFRFIMIGMENARNVFNPAREAKNFGFPVEVLIAEKQQGAIKEPIVIKNNTALVSSTRVSKFAAGQKIDGGKIVSVSSGIDLDTGMYIVKTTGVPDGLYYAEYETTGYFVPLYAVNSDILFVSENGVAKSRKVKTVRQDSDTVLITDGLHDGDIIILSKVNDGDKIKIKSQPQKGL